MISTKLEVLDEWMRNLYVQRALTAKVDKTEIEDELGDLKDRHVSLPPDLVASSGSPVVVVHDDVDEQVEGDDGPGDRGATVELRVAENGGSRVMVDVQEGCNGRAGNVSRRYRYLQACQTKHG